MKNPKSKGPEEQRTPREGEEQQEPTWQDPGSIASDREGEQEQSDEESGDVYQTPTTKPTQQGQPGYPAP
jgi:hypothetical protein